MALNQNAGITFRYRAEMKIGVGIGAVMLLFFSAFLLLEGLTLENLILSGIFLVMLIMIGLVFLRYSSTLTIDEQGVRRTSLFGGETSLNWRDITLYRTGTRRELILVDNMGSNKVRIDPELNGFEQAIEMVRERRRDLWRQPGGIYELHPNWLLLAVSLVAVFLVSLVMLASVSYSSSTDIFFIVGIFLVVMLAAVVSILATSAWRVRLEGDQLTVRRLTGEQRLQANEIGDIRLDVVRAGRSGRIPIIKIITRQGKTNTLRGQFIDAPNLYCVLRTWWEDKRTTVVS